MSISSCFLLELSIRSLSMKRMRRVSISILVFSLLLVAVGNFLSFHSDFFLANHQSTVQSQTQVSSPDINSDHQDNDPCAHGFCHLGHCAKLVFAVASIPKVQIQSQIRFYFKASSVLDLVLDTPYQPPKYA